VSVTFSGFLLSYIRSNSIKKKINFLKAIAITAVTAFLLASCSNGSTDVSDGPKPLTVSLGGGVNMTMNWINPGTFQMGDPTGGDMTWAQPQHSVTLTKGFYMGIYEVTQEQWTAVMTGSDNNAAPSYFTNDADPNEVQLKRPVEQVTWFDAIEFCNLLSERAGLTKVYTINGETRDNGQITAATVTADWSKSGFRLPTEAEWEYACRAGTSTQWSFGNTDANISNYAWWGYDTDSNEGANANEKTHQVGKKTANPWGLYDMHGNVWEWCWDLYDDYDATVASQTDPKEPLSPTGNYSTVRVLRGGSWLDSAASSRSAYRDCRYPDFGSSIIGFRVVRP